MVTKVRKWGNSLALRIPKSFAEEAGVGAGSDVDLTVVDGGLVVKLARRAAPRLADLLGRVNAKNRHEEVETGRPVGREIW